MDSYEDFVRSFEELEYFGQKLGLERVRSLLNALKNPQEKFRSIHIAGTNGKGSTAAMLASILMEAGYRVGLYTSPHLEDFCERIRVNDELITPEEVMRHVRHIREVEKDPLTFFELATAIGFLHFAEKDVDIAVVETGLGGRLDATNVLMPALSVITTIGRDHTAILGETITEIAFEKAGIIKPAKPVVVGPMPDEAMEVIREQATVKKARFVPIVMNLIPPNIHVALEGEHQRQNAALAMSAVDVLTALGEISVDRDAVWRGLENVRWPGRLETVSNEPWILLDGAHNPDAMGVVRSFLEENLQDRRLKVIFGAMADKEITRILGEILPLNSELILTKAGGKRAAAPAEMLRQIGEFTGDVRCYDSVNAALEEELGRLSPQDDEVVLVTGSLFLVGEVRRWLKSHN